jgi:hypothetical protein
MDTKELTENIKQIDEMSHIELCKLWRHAPFDNKYVSGLSGSYLKDRLFGHFGGFTPTISKSIGW